MLQAEEVRQRFTQIEQTIHQMSEACQRAGGEVSNDLRDSIKQLDQRSVEAREQLQQAKDDDSIRQCVDELEELGDQAKAACERSGNIDQQLKNAVMQTHQELSQLKRQLH
jgi:gas vesicle protein